MWKVQYSIPPTVYLYKSAHFILISYRSTLICNTWLGTYRVSKKMLVKERLRGSLTSVFIYSPCIYNAVHKAWVQARRLQTYKHMSPYALFDSIWGLGDLLQGFKFFNSHYFWAHCLFAWIMSPNHGLSQNCSIPLHYDHLLLWSD